jgi:hypothetical protein
MNLQALEKTYTTKLKHCPLIISLVSLTILIVWDRVEALRRRNWLPSAL